MGADLIGRSHGRPWRKVLYEAQPFGDQYTSRGFLQALVVNATVPQRRYARVAWAATAVDQEVSTVAIVGSVSYHLHQGTLHAGQVLCCEACLALAAAGLLALLRQPPHEARRLSGWGALPSAGVLARLALLATATLLLSPLFSTLTRSVSSDTVVACACALLTTHLYLFDYTLSLRPTYELLGSVSTACALCAALLIASRLQSTYQVYAQIMLSLELHIMGPYVRHKLAAASPAAHVATTVGLAATALCLLAVQSRLVAIAFAGACLFIAFACPAWLVRIHKFKAQINGPWDEAAPRLSARLLVRTAPG